METMPKKEKTVYMYIDRKSLETRTLLLAAPLYRKHVQIAARRVVDGEEIETIVDGSIVETKRTTTEGQWLVTNPTGVQFVLDDAVFRARHTATDTDGIYNAVGYFARQSKTHMVLR
ncbi:MAG: hypothetical protein RI996_555 [Candidatus Parcubacteria bacterium]|jgi:hypothetical protein